MFNFEIPRYRAIITILGTDKSEAKDFYFYNEATQYIKDLTRKYKEMSLETRSNIMELEQPETTPDFLELKREALETELDHIKANYKRAVDTLLKTPTDENAREVNDLKITIGLYENEVKDIQKELNALLYPQEEDGEED